MQLLMDEQPLCLGEPVEITGDDKWTCGGINMVARGRRIGFQFFGPRDVGEAFQRCLNARLDEVADEFMAELLAEPAVREIHMEA